MLLIFFFSSKNRRPKRKTVHHFRSNNNNNTNYYYRYYNVQTEYEENIVTGNALNSRQVQQFIIHLYISILIKFVFYLVRRKNTSYIFFTSKNIKIGNLFDLLIVKKRIFSKLSKRTYYCKHYFTNRPCKYT